MKRAVIILRPRGDNFAPRGLKTSVLIASRERDRLESSGYRIATTYRDTEKLWLEVTVTKKCFRNYLPASELRLGGLIPKEMNHALSDFLIAAIAGLTAGAAFAQYEAKQPASPPAAQTQPATPSAGAPTTPNAGAAVTEMQAKARIEAQGFTNVSELKKDAQGMWNAKAMKDGKPVQISLDTRGQIAVLN